ncbi:MAG TPA: isoprenylcysteine carboxylmethyltransferase family protein [Vicinamibacterales bacterium]
MNLTLTRTLAPYRLRTETAGTAVRPLLTGDLIAKVLIVTLFSSLAVRLARDAAATGHVTGLLLLVSEALVAVLTLIRRPASSVDKSTLARVLTVVSVFGPPLVQPASSVAVAPDVLTVLISGVGLTFVVVGKLSLGRSFGLAPANRGVVSAGLYRFIRHPIYMGYLLTHVGFVVANPLDWNIAILVVADVALLFRALREERTLAADPAYRDYMDRVRWRLVPGVF